MATTIIPSNLTVSIVESYSLNGVDYGNSPDDMQREVEKKMGKVR